MWGMLATVFLSHIKRPWERGEMFTGFWFGVLKGRDHWEDPGRGGRITMNCTLGR
jgi:hypothetical protein